MAEHPQTERSEPRDADTFRGVLAIVLVGTALGVTFNGLGLLGRPAWGLSWIGVDRVAEMPKLEDLVTEPAPSNTTMTDPMAVGLGSGSADLPEIPDLDRPVQIELDALRRFVDADAVLIVDAREPEEYEAGHIPGAMNLPYDEASSEPERLEALDAGGKPIVVYCGGGTCELSLGLAWDLLYAGQKRVVVYMGGFGEWAEAGYPVEPSVPAGS